MDDDFEEAVLERMPYPVSPCWKRKNQHEHVALAVWNVEPDGDLVAIAFERDFAPGFDICKNPEAALDPKHVKVADDAVLFPVFPFHADKGCSSQDIFAVIRRATFSLAGWFSACLACIPIPRHFVLTLLRHNLLCSPVV